jgi:hypothetical protein
LRFKLVVGTAIAGCLAILTVAIVRARQEHVAPANATTKFALSAAPPPHGSAPPTAEPAVAKSDEPSPALPVVAPASAAHAPTAAATTATISLAPSAQKGTLLTVDGKRAKSASVAVACGAHTVAVGAEKPRHIDAPCGRTVVVDVGGATPAKTGTSAHAAKHTTAPHGTATKKRPAH